MTPFPLGRRGTDADGRLHTATEDKELDSRHRQGFGRRFSRILDYINGCNKTNAEIQTISYNLLSDRLIYRREVQ